MAAVATIAPEPMMDMNTTPLIDVLLVLLIMIIITVPPQTHKVSIDVGQGTPLPSDRIVNRLDITAHGTALWNGQAVGDRDLAATLAATTLLAPQPELQFRSDAEARYARVDQLLAMTKRAGVTRFGFVGNEAYRRF